ncbi:MAG: hypothetical protein A2541_01580 [Candidatus Taylorbacteria bacterium RIFOXYD2_FULL_36_9]|uniref:Uncharacterized protein n=1 Tax=Candidatus Taylorbacteria bacterium RIFOXYD2_FULL_36_9 TaxID=1802338 RepID=A0A1G2PD17_9BACT|nr:MAG: hypothetical protein A2541_01580 [Candidatus Taylorbacteria bacterium RIFOXYD2_FULL_36_9]
MKYEKLDIKKVEEDLGKLIIDLGLKEITVSWVKDFTYNFSAPDQKITDEYFGFLFSKLPKNISDKNMDRAVKVFNDVWNVFSQKIMGGISPQEKMLLVIDKEKKQETEDIKKGKKLTYDEELWKEHFEQARKGLDKYMDWAFKEVIPKFDKYVENGKLKEKTELIGVAGLFLEMCGQAGMFDFNRLPPMFISDFPEMFEKTVIGPRISKDKLISYLKTFLSFLEIFYGISFPKINKIWE